MMTDNVEDVVMAEAKDEEIIDENEDGLEDLLNAVWDGENDLEKEQLRRSLQQFFERPKYQEATSAIKEGLVAGFLYKSPGVLKNDEKFDTAISTWISTRECVAKPGDERVGKITAGLDRNLIGNHDLSCLRKKIQDTFSWYDKNVEDNYTKYQSPSFPIVQSSGMGKTRLMKQCRDSLRKEGTKENKISSALLLCIPLKGIPPDDWPKHYDGLLEIPSGDTEQDRQTLLDGLNQYLDTDGRVVVFVDEAQMLLTAKHGFAYSCIKWRIREITNAKIVVVFAGTSTNLGMLYMGRRPAPAFSRDSNKSYYNLGTTNDEGGEDEECLKLYPPFLDLTTISCYKGDDASQRFLTDLEKSLFYGRPLFPVLLTEDEPKLRIQSEDWKENEHTMVNPVLYAVLKRMMLSINGNAWMDAPDSKMSILATRVQMGVSTSFEFIDKVTAKGYANLVEYDVDDSRGSKAKSNWMKSRLVFMPDPLCASLAMGMMRKSWTLASSNGSSFKYSGKNAQFWSREAAWSFQQGLFLPEKGDAGEVMVALHMLFCGDELREEKDPSMRTFQISFEQWLMRLHCASPSSPAPPDTMLGNPRPESTRRVSPRRTSARKDQDLKRSKENPHIYLDFESRNATVSFIQVCRNYFRSHSWFTQEGLEYMYKAAIACYAFPNCPAFDIVAPIRIVSGDDEENARYYPLLVSVKCWDKIRTSDMEMALQTMENYVNNYRRPTEAETKAYCLLVVVGSSKASEPLKPRGGPLPSKDVFACVVLSGGADEFGISSEMKRLAKMFAVTEMRASHYMAYVEEPELAFRSSLTGNELKYGNSMFRNMQPDSSASAAAEDA